MGPESRATRHGRTHYRATHEGQAYVQDLRFAALPPEMVKKIDDKLKSIRLRTKDEPK